MLQTVFDESEDFGAKFKWEGDFTVHDAANVMRRFLNHLPEPVITLDHYRAFKDTMSKSGMDISALTSNLNNSFSLSHVDDEFPSLDAKIQAFQNLILSLPLVHQYLLLYIMDMLGLFSMTRDKTRMDVSALAAVFAPVSFYLGRAGGIMQANSLFPCIRASCLIPTTNLIQLATRNHNEYSNS